MTVIPMNRQPKGVTVGGQFAATAHAEPSVSLGRHAALTSNRDVPESLRMAHFQSPKLIPDLEWEVERSIGVSDGEIDYHCETFSDLVPHLQVEEAYSYFNQAVDARSRGGDWQAVVAEAAAADTARHPGGQLKDGYVPPLVKHQPGYQQGVLSTGSKYTGYRDATDICKDIRVELKAATDANYLPAGLKYSVTNDKYSGGQSINVTVQGVSDADRLDYMETDHNGGYAQSREAKELQARVDAITNSYNQSDIDSQSDYFQTAYWGRAEIETDSWREFRESEAAKRKAAASARAARK
ncbi:hypothetical protein IV500_05825 [Paeniglutamicibacter antarcticus]|uniref:Uncharacterized protein n=1 Tax=Arthrobacter terrae TaxID=2935737 RepID=A0A931G3Q8_9MICC|nr:hypothetical protein [Arthrobacter terrae]MBG0738941.1 hypothetical protein [Arthrobacter terrae]